MNWPAIGLTLRNTTTTVTNYGIWRSTRPYFDPDAANCNCTKVAETTNLNWNDNGSVGPITPIGDVNNNYFYVVRAQNERGLVAQFQPDGRIRLCPSARAVAAWTRSQPARLVLAGECRDVTVRPQIPGRFGHAAGRSGVQFENCDGRTIDIPVAW